MTTHIAPGDLQYGDVLLAHGSGLLCGLIQLFDGSEYCHAAFWDGKQVYESIGKGLSSTDLKVFDGRYIYVDVYRYHSDQNIPLTAIGAGPLQACVARYQAVHERYAYEALLLLAVLGATRRFTSVNPMLRMIVRQVLDAGADLLAEIAAAGRQPMICSELVYRLFTESDPSYPVHIHGGDIGLLGADREPQDPELEEMQERFLAEYRMASGMGVGTFGSMSFAGGGTAANFVTPHDLRESPNLKYLGVLKL